VLKSGQLKGSYYRDIKFPEYETGEDREEIVSFLAPPKIVMITGKGIAEIYKGKLRLTLAAVHEYDGRPAKAGALMVTIIDIIEPAIPDRDEKNGLRLVTPAKKAE
jgi:hypothetical protein